MTTVPLLEPGLRTRPRFAQSDVTDQRRRSRQMQAAITGAASLADGLAVMAAVSLAGVPWPSALVPAAAATLLLRKAGLHRGRLTLRISDDAASVIGRTSAALLVTAPLVATPLETWLLSAVVTACVAVLSVRALVYRVVTAGRRRGVAVNDVLIVGAGQVGADIARTLGRRPEFGLRAVGYVDRFPDELDLPILGPTESLPRIIADHGIRHVILAFGHAREAEMVSIVRGCSHLSVDLYTLPRFFELGHAADPRSSEDLWGFPLVRLRSGGRESYVRRTKRVFDIAVAATAGVLLAPVILVCAVAVRVTSSGPVLFRQERVGQLGRPMEMLKFRTMTVNDDSDTTWSVDSDQRVTSVGRFLRPTHLDELPQLWNVLRGDMSVVGPRPERRFFVDQFSSEIAGYAARHRYPVGLTGWAQVNGLWGDTSIEDRARLDNGYIEDWSLWRDVVILCRTVPTLLGRRDA
jgi:exopolysaccharide biosynthesis polyprenyl glycosylphosphotransferase